MFSNRGVLKIFQEVKALPREEALDRIGEFWEIAVNDFVTTSETGMLLLRLRADPAKYEEYKKLAAEMGNRGAIGGSSMFYVPMLLAAHLGENTLLVNQMDEIQRIMDEGREQASESDLMLARESMERAQRESPDSIRPLLEANAVFSLLMYAAQQAGVDLSEAGIPFDAIEQEVILLVPWDAEWTPYDYPVHRGGVQLDPKDADEQFTVYSFPRFQRPRERFFDDEGQKGIINTLKEILSR